MSLDPSTEDLHGAGLDEHAAGSAEPVVLSMPARPEMWALARMTVSLVASRIELGYEEISDLRLAIDELCTLCALGSTEASRLTLTFSTDDEGVRIECVAEPLGPVSPGHRDDEIVGLVPAQLSERILEALVDGHGIAEEPGVRRGWLRKLRPSG